MYFIKLLSVVCPLIDIISKEGIPARYALVQNERLAVCVTTNSNLYFFTSIFLPPIVFDTYSISSSPILIIPMAGKSKVDSIGGAELATAGSGDVLAGLIGSMLAANSTDPFQLVCNAVELHSRAGRYAAAKFESVSALEIMDCLTFV